VTSAAAYRDASVRHSAGSHLAELVDVVIDTHVPHGDAALTLDGLAHPVGAMSTAIGAAVVQALVVETVTALLADGNDPAILVSANVGDTPDLHEQLGETSSRIRHR
jgi:uncharacterized phosphosugar-binding protein